MKRFFLFVAVLLVCGISTSLAQDAKQLQDALKKLDGVETSFRGQFSEEQPESGNLLGDLLGGVGGVEIENSGVGIIGGSGPGFQGELEIYVGKEGAVASASTGDLPAIKTYRHGRKRLFHQTHNGRSTDVVSVGKLLRVTTDFSSMAKELDHVKVRSEATSEGTKYRATIEGEYFQPNSGQGNRFQEALSEINAKIIEGIFEAVVGSDGNIKSMSFELLYNDPMGAMMEKAMDGGAGVPQDLADLVGSSDSEGKTVTINFTFDDSESKIAQAFAEEASELLNK